MTVAWLQAETYNLGSTEREEHPVLRGHILNAMVTPPWDREDSTAGEQWKEYRVICPCGSYIDARLCDWVDAGETPDLKQALLESRLNHVKCRK